jgi:2-iminobutanoate/2-iminopropanoate deaminase
MKTGIVLLASLLLICGVISKGKIMKTVINTKNAPAPIGPYSQAVMVNDMLFVSGQVPINPATGEVIKGSINDETKQVMENLKAILTEAGLDFSHVVKTTIFLKDMNNFKNVNEVYGSYFTKDFPARETVEVARLPKDVNVEISVVAAK